MTEKEINDITFRIGMSLHKIGMSLPDFQLEKIKPYMIEIEEKVIELSKAAKTEKVERVCKNCKRAVIGSNGIINCSYWNANFKATDKCGYWNEKGGETNEK